MENNTKLDWNSFKGMFHKSWHNHMQAIIESEELWEIFQTLKAETRKVTPPSGEVFKSFQIDLDKLKVVVMGQSPYPQVNLGNYKACGLAFDCSSYGEVSPSLRKLYEAIEDDEYNGMKLSFDHGTLSLQYLVDQGVMLTNSALTCTKDNPTAHEELWVPFWRAVFDNILWTKTGLIFIFMGKQAQNLEQYTDPFAHHILKCEHPAKSSYEKRKMIHNNVFSKANKLIQGMNGIQNRVEWLKDQMPF